MRELIRVQVDYKIHANKKLALELDISVGALIPVEKDFRCKHFLDFIILFNQWLSDDCINVDDIKSITEDNGSLGYANYYDVGLYGKSDLSVAVIKKGKGDHPIFADRK